MWFDASPPEEGKWYPGTIDEINRASQPPSAHVSFDDKDTQWIDDDSWSWKLLATKQQNK